MSNYLMMEAKAKRGIPNPTEAVCRKLQVPVQPNYSDCGLYLLHLTQVFLSDPDKIVRRSAISKRLRSDELAKLWHEVKVKTMREEMRARILHESEIWQRGKAEKDTDATAEKGKEKEKDAEATEATDGDASDPTAKESVPAQTQAGPSAPTNADSDSDMEVSEVFYSKGAPRERTAKPKPTRRKTAARLR